MWTCSFAIGIICGKSADLCHNKNGGRAFLFVIKTDLDDLMVLAIAMKCMVSMCLCGFFLVMFDTIDQGIFLNYLLRLRMAVLGIES